MDNQEFLSEELFPTPSKPISHATMPQEVKDWTNYKEFFAPMHIVPQSLQHTADTKAADMFKDQEGKVWRLSYIDLDHEKKMRYFETKFTNLKDAMAKFGVR